MNKEEIGKLIDDKKYSKLYGVSAMINLEISLKKYISMACVKDMN